MLFCLVHTSEVPSSLLLLSVAFIMRDTMTLADKRGPQAVKIAVLETKQRRYHNELKLLQGKIRDVGLDLQRERSELEAAEQAELLAQRYAYPRLGVSHLLVVELPVGSTQAHIMGG
eukprot:COSAG02_NODE_861_length_16429_cov_75.930680_16_plen_117_part_00